MDTTYTVTAKNMYKTITERYDNAASAFAAYYWHQWDKAAAITCSDGRKIADSIRYDSAPMTDDEEESCRRQHHLYYWERQRTDPTKSIGFISSHTERR